MSAAEFLAEVKRAVETATPGPWDAYTVPAHRREPGYTAVGVADTEVRVVRFEGSWFDAAFIARARTDVPRLVAALEAVLALHGREVIAVHEGYGEEAWCPLCQQHWPCDTVLAIESALEEGEDGA